MKKRLQLLKRGRGRSFVQISHRKGSLAFSFLMALVFVILLIGCAGDGRMPVITHHLFVSVAPEGAGQVQLEGQPWSVELELRLEEERGVLLHALSNVGWEFVSWIEHDEEISRDNPLNLIIHEDRRLVAFFQRAASHLVLGSPPDQATGVTLRPQLTWEVIPEQPMSFRLFLAPVSEPFGPPMETEAFQFTPDLEPDTHYRWMLEGDTVFGQTISSSVSFFSTRSPQQPPVNVFPEDGTAKVLPTLLSWSSSSRSDSEKTRFSIFASQQIHLVEAMENSARIAENLEETEFLFDPVDRSSPWYWRVVSHQSGGSMPGEVWSFLPVSVFEWRQELIDTLSNDPMVIQSDYDSESNRLHLLFQKGLQDDPGLEALGQWIALRSNWIDPIFPCSAVVNGRAGDYPSVSRWLSDLAWQEMWDSNFHELLMEGLTLQWFREETLLLEAEMEMGYVYLERVEPHGFRVMASQPFLLEDVMIFDFLRSDADSPWPPREIHPRGSILGLLDNPIVEIKEQGRRVEIVYINDEAYLHSGQKMALDASHLEIFRVEFQERPSGTILLERFLNRVANIAIDPARNSLSFPETH